MGKSIDGKKLNKEQLKAVRYQKGPLLIIAGAGTGKTTVITERINWLIRKKLATPAEILALTFTQKAAMEMEERVDKALPFGYTELWISTFHGFCENVLRADALEIGLDPGFRMMSEAEAVIFLRKNIFRFELDYFRPMGNPYKFIVSLLTHFSRLKDEDITPDEYIHWVKSQIPCLAGRQANPKSQFLGEKLDAEKYLELARAYRRYEEMKMKEGMMDFADLITNTLKLFRTRRPVLEMYQKKYKYLLIDEFQDTNIAQNTLAILLAGEKKNITVVGDDDQCLPLGTQIRTIDGSKPIEQIKRGESVVSACGKGYTTLAKVIEVVRSEKYCEFLTITTVDGHEVTVTENHKMFCLTPSKVFGEKPYYYVYLMERKGLGWRLGVTNDLAQRLRLERSADRIIGIKACKSEEEARYHEIKYSLKYSIPTICFKNRDDMISRPEWSEKIYQDFNTDESVKKLAQDINIDLKTHHFSLGGVYRGSKSRTKINILLCRRRNRTKWARNRYLLNPQISHAVYVETSDNKILERMKKAGLNLVKAKKGWKFSKTSIDLIEIGNTAQKLQELTEGIVEAKFDVGKSKQYAKSANVIPAKNLLPGLYTPILKGFEIQYEQIKTIKKEKKKLTVFDLEIGRTHNFVADNVVVHNSIYRWRGAAISNIVQFRKKFKKAKIVVLDKNYRSTVEILISSYKLIQNNNPDRLEIKEKISKKLISARDEPGEKIEFLYMNRVEDEAEEVIKKIKSLHDEKNWLWSDFAILIRANNHADPFVHTLIRHGLPFQILGPSMLFKQKEVKDLIAYLKCLNNPIDSVAFFRVLSMSIFNLDMRDLAIIMNFAEKLGFSLFEAVEVIIAYETDNQDHWSRKKNYRQYLPRLSQKTFEQLSKIYRMLEKHLSLTQKNSAGQILYYFLEDTGLLQKITEYKSVYEEREALNISKFFDRIKSFETREEDASVKTVVDYLDMAMELGESPRSSEIDSREQDAVNILTVHQSKGLEFKAVFLVNLVTGRFPSRERKEKILLSESLIKEILPEGDAHLQEERRLFYVAATRACDRLFFSASTFYGDGKRERKISPFVYETLGIDLLPTTSESVKQLSLLQYKKYPQIAEKKVFQPINYLSYTRISTYLTCPLQYKYRYELKIPVPISSAASFGSSIHLALQKFYEMVRARKKVTKKDLLIILDKVWLPVGYKDRAFEEKMHQRGEKMLTDYFDKFYQAEEIPLELEQLFTIRLNENLKIGGKIDRVDNLGQGKIEIVDYKTGKMKSPKEIKDDLQMTVYAMAATDKGIYHKQIEEVVLSFYFLGNQEKISSIRTKEQLDSAKERLIEIAGEIEAEKFKAKVGTWCTFCDFRLICEAWQ